MHRPIHFEFHSADTAKTRKFFSNAFGWKFQDWEGPMEYTMVSTGEGAGIDGGLMPSRDGNQRTVNTIEVENVDDACKTIEKHGGQVVVPKMAIPGVGYLAYGTDPMGVLFGVMHADESAS